MKAIDLLRFVELVHDYEIYIDEFQRISGTHFVVGFQCQRSFLINVVWRKMNFLILMLDLTTCRFELERDGFQ